MTLPSARAKHRRRLDACWPDIDQRDQEREQAFANAARVLSREKVTHIAVVHGDDWTDPRRETCGVCLELWEREERLQRDFEEGRL